MSICVICQIRLLWAGFLPEFTDCVVLGKSGDPAEWLFLTLKPKRDGGMVPECIAHDTMLLSSGGKLSVVRP